MNCTIKKKKSHINNMLSISFVYLAKTFWTLKQLYPFFNNK